MKTTVGIIAEYNPFHNGHQTLVNLAKSAGYSNCIAVMSGNFVQRAGVAITEKRIRTHAALKSGVDMIIELPLPYAVASASYFAYGAVATLKATGAVDAICFGSELGEIQPLKEIVDTFGTEEYKIQISDFLKTGVTFAQARTMAVGKILGKRYAEIAKTPNNVLAIEYLVAIKKLKWQINVLTFKRIDVDHDSQTPSVSFASASYLRTLKDSTENLSGYVPSEALKIYENAIEKKLYPADFSKLEMAIISYLRRLTLEDIRLLPDISEGIENRFIKAIASAVTINQLYESIKTKRYPLSRVRRLVLNAFLGIKAYYLNIAPPYIRLLGLKDGNNELLKRIKKNAEVPFGHGLKKLSQTSPMGNIFANLEAFATDQYMLTMPNIQKSGYDFYSSAVFLKQH